AELRRFSKRLPQVRVATLSGGASIETQMRALRRGVSVVVATPGRLLDLRRRGFFQPSEIKYLVLDEADEMLNMGFRDELDEILSALPEDRKTWLYSATLPKGVKRIAQRFMRETRELNLTAEAPRGQDGGGEQSIEHLAFNIPKGKKYPALLRLLDATADLYAMVFCRTRVETQALADRLSMAGVSAGALHGDLSQARRDQVMGAFKARRFSVLIATDIAARGIDVDELTHVIHYDLPDQSESYTHRSGRTGRAGRHGVSLILVEPRDRGRAERIARGAKVYIQTRPLPTSDDVVKRHLGDWLRALQESCGSEVLARHFSNFEALLSPLLERSQEELLALVAAQALSHQLIPQRLLELNPQQMGRSRNDRRGDEGREYSRRDRGRDEEQLRPQGVRSPFEDRGPRGERGQRPQSPRPSRQNSGPHGRSESTRERVWARVEVSVGRSGGLDEATLRSTLERGSILGAQLRQLSVSDTGAHFEVPSEKLNAALKSFKGFRLSGQKVRARRAE
ncbi:MAG: DEAD/DEAH box helicase, partial [Myxococcota bacterium]|nr:DEAD/DEAH box helicase [Myxococcota bacterium]